LQPLSLILALRFGQNRKHSKMTVNSLAHVPFRSNLSFSAFHYFYISHFWLVLMFCIKCQKVQNRSKVAETLHKTVFSGGKSIGNNLDKRNRDLWLILLLIEPILGWDNLKKSEKVKKTQLHLNLFLSDNKIPIYIRLPAPKKIMNSTWKVIYTGH
jgi:hypothetical protein